MISASKNIGIKDLFNLIVLHQNKYNRVNIFSKNIENIISNKEIKLQNVRNKRFLALEKISNSNDYETLINERYKFITSVCKKCITYTKMRRNVGSLLDKIFLNKLFAVPIFVMIMFFIYYISITFVGNNVVGFIDNFLDIIKGQIENLLINVDTSKWLVSLVCDGIITGVGSVLTFLPQLITLFFCISILESTGYMSRISFILDKLFRKFGLSGKTLIPFIVGSGCSVPGVMSTRILESEYDKNVSAVLTPFIPCSARLPIIALFTSYFFSENYAFIAISFYLISIVIIIISALIFKKLFNEKYESTYISELPEYKIPNLKYVLRDVYDRTKEFVKKAGTLIFASAIVVWILLSFSMNLEYGVEIENSILACIGKKASWIFTPIIGFDSWEATVSAIQGVIAKEQVVSSMQIIAGLSSDGKNIAEIFGTGGPFDFFNKASAYSYVVFNLFCAPCFATIATINKEVKKIWITLLALIYQITFAWMIAFTIYKFFNYMNI